MPTSAGHKPSSNSAKGSNDRPSSIGSCNTAISPHKINPETRPTLLYSTHKIAPNHLTTHTFIKRISRREVENARFLREAIETAIARRAAQSATPETIEPLFDILDAQERCGDQPDQVRFLALDDALHQAIARLADCERGWRVIEDLKAQMDRVRFLSIASATPARTIVVQHRELVAAIADNAPDAAEAAMRQHLREMLTSLPVVVAHNPDAFEA